MKLPGQLLNPKSVLLLLLLLLGLGVMAQQQQYAQKFALIDSLKQFIVHDLKLDPDTGFYTRWDTRKDSMFIYLYVSMNDRVQVPEGYPSPVWPFYKQEDAINRSRQLQALGYETMVYRTAGTSDAYLTPKLLSYPNEAIAFIVIHEATHRRKKNGRPDAIPYYTCEEALADAVANAGCVRFARQSKMLDMKKVLIQKKTFEKIYAEVNSSLAALKATGPSGHSKILKVCNAKIWKLADKGNQFVKDRIQYPVNHAYFLRVTAYALHYFEIARMLDADIDIAGTVKKLHRLFAYQVQPAVPAKKNPVEIKLPPQPSFFDFEH